MKLFRNTEIKIKMLVYIIFSLIMSLLGFLIGGKSGYVVLITSMGFIFISFLSDKRRYRDIAKLSNKMDEILHGHEAFYIKNYKEGELSILENEISKMTIRLREQGEMLKKDKIDLKDSLADISHQIKTPLTSINLLLSLLEKDDLEKERRFEIIKEIESLIMRMSWLVSSLLKLSQIEAGTIEMKKEKISMEKLLKKCLEPMAIQMDLNQQTVSLDIEEASSFVGDFSWTQEALTNIIKNSMEHNQVGGEIIIKVRENPIYIEVIIKDNGKGIPKKDLSRLFDRFYKGEKASKSSVGIGLALSKKIINQQNGTIRVSNNSDQGANFRICFYK